MFRRLFIDQCLVGATDYWRANDGRNHQVGRVDCAIFDGVSVGGVLHLYAVFGLGDWSHLIVTRVAGFNYCRLRVAWRNGELVTDGRRGVDHCGRDVAKYFRYAATATASIIKPVRTSSN